MSNYEIFDSFFEHQVKYMYAGIEATMTKRESIYTCALALSTYTEIMGGLVTGNLKITNGESRNNYEAFLPYLGQKYVDLNTLIQTEHKDRLRNLYGAVRSKLVHEFALSESHTIWFYEQAHEDKIGIELISNKIDAEMIHINFLIPEYYRDFKNGITKYYNELKDWKNHDVFDRIILGNFLKATVNNFSSE